jgi:hypothetical protein
MKTNVGTVDMIIRIILAVVVFALGFYFNSWWGLLGLLPLMTGVVRFCPAYWLLKISTAEKKEA